MSESTAPEPTADADPGSEIEPPLPVDEAPSPPPPPEDPRLVRAQALWEAGDVLSTREIIGAIDGQGLSPTDALHYQRLHTATSWDRVHVWVGLALLIMWASLMFLAQ